MTPMNMKSLPWSETVKITRDWTSTSLETLGKMPRKQSQPLRYIYMSGHFAPRERTEAPKVLSDNNLMEAGYLRVCLHHELLPDLVPRPTNIFLRVRPKFAFWIMLSSQRGQFNLRLPSPASSLLLARWRPQSLDFRPSSWKTSLPPCWIKPWKALKRIHCSVKI